MTMIGPVVCMQMKENIDAPRLKIWRYSLKMLSIIAQGKDVIYAGADVKYPNSGKFLEKLGFEYLGEDLNGAGVFVCRVLKQ